MNVLSPLNKLAMLALVGSPSVAAMLGLAATAHADAPVNLRINDTVRAELLQTGADLHGVPASEYVGLAPGETYYAYDPDTLTYWAGASLRTRPNPSERAQVSGQDAGSYILYKKIKGGLWTAFNIGAGDPDPQECPQNLPLSIMNMWGWDPLYCRPRI
ncbi:MAG: hypothetical protein QOD39_582 [Mycobacterium sp.]|nr:hypothetical protein [Mycobacterium sp.]